MSKFNPTNGRLTKKRLTESITGNSNAPAGDVVEGLQILLSSYKVHHQNAHALHLNSKGRMFFVAHDAFKTVYLDAFDTSDVIAERILALKESPLSSYTQYLQTSLIPECGCISDYEEAIAVVVNSQNVLLELQAKIFAEAVTCGDDGTATLLSDMNIKLQKSNWMFTSSL